jgi:hypothetical protein
MGIEGSDKGICQNVGDSFDIIEYSHFKYSVSKMTFLFSRGRHKMLVLKLETSMAFT